MKEGRACYGTFPITIKDLIGCVSLFVDRSQFVLTPKAFHFTFHLAHDAVNLFPFLRVLESVVTTTLVSNELGTETVLCSGRQCGLRLSLLATTSHQRLRCDSGLEEWISVCGTVRDIIQVSRSAVGELSLGS